MTQNKVVEEWIDFVHKVFRNEILMFDDKESSSFSDHVFNNEMNKCLKIAKQHYSNLQYREAFNSGFYQIQKSFFKYNRLSVERLKKELVMKYIEVQAILLAPMHPTISEYIWQLLEKPTLVMYAEWPRTDWIDDTAIEASNHVIKLQKRFQKELDKFLRRRNLTTTTSLLCTIYVVQSYSSWQEMILKYLRSLPHFDINKVCSELKKVEELKEYENQITPFVLSIQELILCFKMDLNDFYLPFDEKQVLEENLFYLKYALKLNDIKVEYQNATSKEICFPGHPVCTFEDEQ